MSSARLSPPSEPRLRRLELGITLNEAAAFAGIPLVRASEIEREPERARPGELEALLRGALDAKRRRTEKRGA